jgi:hypothetical protein
MNCARTPIIWVLGLLVLSGLASAATVAPEEQVGPAKLEGVISSERGEPLVGAIISVFGANLATGALTAISDENGYFRISDLPPGFYTLRAYLSGFLPSPSSHIEVAGEGELARPPLSMKMAPLAPSKQTSLPLTLDPDPGDGTDELSDEERRVAELKWLLRHTRRNVLHQRARELVYETEEPAPDSQVVLPGTEIAGEVGVMAAGLQDGLRVFPGGGAGLDARLAFANLDIPTGSRSHWEVSAQLMESVMSSWVGSARFVMEATSGHEVTAGISYGNHLYGDVGEFRPPEAGLSYQRNGERSMEWFGSVFGNNRFNLGSAAVDAGMAYHHYSYLDQTSYAAPHVAVSWSPGNTGNTVLRGKVDYQVHAPGSENLDILARMVSADFVGPAGDAQRGLRAERTIRSQVSVAQDLGEVGVVEFLVFQESAANQIVKAYLEAPLGAGVGPGHYQVENYGDFRTRGVGLAVSKRFGSVASSVGYRFGLARALSSVASDGSFELGNDEEIHDLTTTVETKIDCTRTRLLAVYRLIRQPSIFPTESESGTSLNSRFNVQVYQMLPFEGWNSTEFELMLAVRNLFYEDLENASFLDELAVIDSPRRVLGGVSVRF